MQRFGRTHLGIMILATLAASATTKTTEAQFSGDQFRGFVAPDPTALSVDPAPPGGPSNAGTWLGGDLGSMALLPNGTMIACFCDPDIGPGPNAYPGGFNQNTERQGNYASMGNSIAIMTASGGQTHVQHYFRGNTGTYGDTASYRGKAFFPILEPPASYPMKSQYDAANAKYNARIWVRKPIVIGTSLYVFGNFVTNPPAQGGGFQGTNNVENTLIMRVTNPTDPPAAWNISYLTLGIFNSAAKNGFPTWATNQPAPCFFGNEAFTLNDGYLYTYGTYYPGYTSPTNNLFAGFTVYPLRIPIADLQNAQANTDVSANAQYFSTNQQWQNGLYDPTNLSMLSVGNQTNFASLAYSVRFNSSLNLWQAVFNYEAVMAGRTQGSTDPRGYSAYIQTSQYPYGPWSTPVQAFLYPGLSQTTTSNGTTTTVNINAAYQCYAVREVPMLESSDRVLSLVFTTLDASDPSTWASDYTMYVPLEYDTPNPIQVGGNRAMFSPPGKVTKSKTPRERPTSAAGALRLKPTPLREAAGSATKLPLK